VEVDGPEYDTVSVLSEDDAAQFDDGPYSGTEIFEMDSPIEGAIVQFEGGEVEQLNPDFEACIPTPTPDPYGESYVKSNAKEPSYDELFRNFEDYEGEPIRFERGEVYQAQYPENQDYDYFQMWVSQADPKYEDDIAAVWYGGERYLEDDVFSPLYGVAERLFSYETVQGDERTIPLLTLVHVELQE
jgi:hypothetical protein